jgi:diguanylate cyclase (GGDEF)-like protein
LLTEEFRRARRYECPLGLALVDVDYFKAYNDFYGHVAGDDCLRRISRAVAGVLRRPGDRAARYGGEEIVIVLPSTDEYGAMVVAERVRAAVASECILHRRSPYGVVTMSGGVSALHPVGEDAAPSSLIDAADRALYQAKSAGRNRVYPLGCP